MEKDQVGRHRGGCRRKEWSGRGQGKRRTSAWREWEEMECILHIEIKIYTYLGIHISDTDHIYLSK